MTRRRCIIHGCTSGQNAQGVPTVAHFVQGGAPAMLDLCKMHREMITESGTNKMDFTFLEYDHKGRKRR